MENKLNRSENITLETVKQLTDRYCPIVHLSSHEQYRPTSIDEYLSQVSLYDKNGHVVTKYPEVNQEIISTAQPDDYLQIENRDVRHGNLSIAPFYVRFTKVGTNNEYFDIEYWFFYAFNGPSSIGVRLDIGHKRPTLRAQIPPFGEHQGDWEHVTVRINAQTSELFAIYTAEHGWGTWHWPNKIPMSGTRPIVYSAVNSHATYTHIGKEMIKSKKLGVKEFGFVIGLIDSTDENGLKWDPLDDGAGVNVASVNVDGLSFQPQLWTKFHGHWGPPTNQKKQVHAAIEIVYHLLKHEVPHGFRHVLKKTIEKFVKKLWLLRVILPGGPSTPSIKKAWPLGERSHPEP